MYSPGYYLIKKNLFRVKVKTEDKLRDATSTTVQLFKLNFQQTTQNISKLMNFNTKWCENI